MYIENVFVCMAAPLLVGMFVAGRRYYFDFWFILAGMAACLLSAYVNSFFTGFYHADVISAASEITPVVEEIIKLFPLLFYLLVFEPEQKKARIAIIIIDASFATFENICWMTENGAARLDYLLLRGFSTGAMHVVCGTLVGYGLVFVWQRPWLKAAGTMGLLCAAITFHAMYNLLISFPGVIRNIGYGMPIVTAVLCVAGSRLHRTLDPADDS